MDDFSSYIDKQFEGVDPQESQVDLTVEAPDEGASFGSLREPDTSETVVAEPAAEPEAESSTPTPIPQEGPVNKAIAVGDYRNPVGYELDKDAGYEVLRGIKNVTGIDLGVDEYVERQTFGQATPLDVIGREAVSIPAGAALGAAEAVGSTVEILGDTKRAEVAKVAEVAVDAITGLLPEQQQEAIRQVTDNLFTLAGATEENNPFSDQYQWSKWNLGKDTYGSQSPVGQVVQGFGEFAILLGATGGFGGAANVGARFASAGSALGKAKVVAGAAAKEGLYGIAADMVSASKGEGNMANMVRDAFPALEGTFLTALAVEEDDNPWEAMFKTAIDGFLVGMPIGAIGAWMAGARQAGKALRNGATEAEATEVAVKASAEHFEKTAATTPKSDRTANLQEALRTSTPERFENLSQIVDLEFKGIPTTWDDAAAVVPEYFVPGIRALSQPVPTDIPPNFNVTINRLKAGERQVFDVTTDTTVFGDPNAQYLVKIDGADGSTTDLSEEGIADFFARNNNALTRGDAFVMAQNLGKETELTVVRAVADEQEAVFLGRLFDQETVFDGSTNTLLSTGGKQQLDETIAANLSSPFDRPSTKPPVDPNRAIAQQYKAEQAVTPGGGAERAVTNAQLKRIAKAGTSDEAMQVLREMVESTPIDLKQIQNQTNIPRAELVRRAGIAISDALGSHGQVDFSKIRLIQYGDEKLLSSEGIVQVKGLMAETAQAIATSAFRANTATKQGLDAVRHVKEMSEQLKALLHIHKASARVYGRVLANYQVEATALSSLVDSSAFKVDTQTLDANLKQASELLDKVVDGLERNDPKSRAQALRLASQIEMLGGDVSKLVGITYSLRELGTGKALQIMYNSLLSSPTTQLVNNVSNLFNTFYRPITAWSGGDKAVKQQAQASFANFGQTVSDAYKMAALSFKENKPMTQGSKMDLTTSQVGYQLDQLTKEAEISDDTGFKLGVGFVNMLADIADFPLFTIPSRLLTTSDEFFKTMVARMEFNRLMMEKAQKFETAEGLDAAFKSLLESEYSRNFTASGQILNPDLVNAAKEVTFQQDLLSGSSIQHISTMTKLVPESRIFFPFIKTGHNIMVFTGTHVPVLNLALRESREVLMNPNADPFQKAMMKGRMAYGSLTIATAGLLLMQGKLTGNGPSDPKRYKEWEKTHQPRSIKFGDTWVSYERVEPFGQILSAIADVHYAFNSGELEVDKAQYLMQYLGFAIAANLTNKTFFAGFSQLSALIDPKGGNAPERVLNAGLSIANNFLPYAGARRMLANAFQPTMLEFNSTFDRFLHSATMGLAGEKALSYDFLDGHPITASRGGWNSLLPVRFVERKTDPLRDALEDIEFDYSAIMKEVGGVDLPPSVTSYIQQKMFETGVRERLERYMLNKNFRDMVEKYKKDLRDGRRVSKENQYFYRNVQDIIRDARDLALQRARQEFPDFDQEIREAQENIRLDRKPQDIADLIDYGN